MTAVIPNSNLPASSQPWGREIQKRIQSLESEILKQKTNSASADSQIESSYKRLDETVTEISKLSEVGSDYKVNVDNLVGERFTSNGITFKISNPNVRREYQDRIVGQIYSEPNGIVFGTGFVNIDGDFVGVSLTQEYFSLVIDGRAGLGGNSDRDVVIKPSLRVDGYITASGGVAASGSSNLSINKFFGGGTTGASIDNLGSVIRTTSSERYKQDIEPLQVNYEELLSLEPKRFKFKSEASEDENARYYAGFIAEEVAETSLTDFVAYTTDEDGNKIPDGVYYAELSAALLTAIKHQDELIKSLSARVDTLEDKV
jgi:hypothetical protein